MGSPSGLLSGVIGSGWVGCAQGRGQRGQRGTVLQILDQHIRGQCFSAHAEMQRLFRGEYADRAPLFQKSIEAQLGRENRGERNQNERDDERHAALPVTAGRKLFHPATSISRRTAPQSLN